MGDPGASRRGVREHETIQLHHTMATSEAVQWLVRRPAPRARRMCEASPRGRAVIGLAEKVEQRIDSRGSKPGI